MPLVHDDPDFDHLLRIVAARRGLAVGLVEKDYWVTHVLWSLHDRGFEVWFKGGTSLSKGFGLIERFSEDLDLKIEPGHVADLPLVTDWHRESRRATDQRRAYFEALPDLLRVPGADAGLALGADGTRWTGANIELRYPVRHAEGLGPLRPFVLLEVGSARVTPSVERDLTSFVHEYLGATDRLGDYDDNRPRAVRCVHPLVTLSVIVLTSIVFSLAGLLNALFAKTFDDISIVPTFVLAPLTYLGGVFFSIELLSPFWQSIARVNPILYMVNAFRFGMLGESDIPLAHAFAIILIAVAALFALAMILLKRGIGVRT